jgi:hypothetical protein
MAKITYCLSTHFGEVGNNNSLRREEMQVTSSSKKDVKTILPIAALLPKTNLKIKLFGECKERWEY